MHRKLPLSQLIYSNLYPNPQPTDPPSFSAHLAKYLVGEVRIETATFYGSLDTVEARYPGLNYAHGPHRRRLGRFPHHARLFQAFDALGLTDSEIAGFCRWEGTLWARQRYEKDEGITVRDTTGEEIGPWSNGARESRSRRSRTREREREMQRTGTRGHQPPAPAHTQMHVQTPTETPMPMQVPMVTAMPIQMPMPSPTSIQTPIHVPAQTQSQILTSAQVHLELERRVQMERQFQMQLQVREQQQQMQRHMQHLEQLQQQRFFQQHEWLQSEEQLQQQQHQRQHLSESARLTQQQHLQQQRSQLSLPQHLQLQLPLQQQQRQQQQPISRFDHTPLNSQLYSSHPHQSQNEEQCQQPGRAAQRQQNGVESQILVEQQQDQQQQQQQFLFHHQVIGDERQGTQNKSDDAEMRDEEEEEKEENKHSVNVNNDVGDVTNTNLSNNGNDANSNLIHDDNDLALERVATELDDSNDESILANVTTNLLSDMSESTATITPTTIGARIPISGTQQHQTIQLSTNAVADNLSEFDEWLKETRERDTLGSIGSMGSLNSLGPLSTIRNVVSARAGRTSVAGNVVSETGGQDTEIPVQA